MEPCDLIIIELCIEKELLLADLYYAFAARYPAHRAFWEKLAGEETEHAGWVRFLREQAELGRVSFTEGKTRVGTVKTFIEHVRSVRTAAEASDYPLARALVATLDIERSLIEKNPYGQFSGSVEKVEAVLHLLSEGMRDHVLEVEAYVSKFKGPL